MGKLNYAGFAPSKPADFAAPFGKLALDACNAELSARRKFSRNHLKVCLTAAANGLKGVESLATAPEDQQFVGQLSAAVGGLLGVVIDKGLSDTELEAELQDPQGELGQLRKLMTPAS